MGNHNKEKKLFYRGEGELGGAVLNGVHWRKLGV